MNNSTVNFTTPETSTNFTTQSIGLMDRVEICVYGISLLFGFPMHTYVIWLIVTGTGVASEFLNLNLSVCEFINCLNSLVSILSICFSNHTMLPLVLQGLVFTGCSLFQSLICVERYLAVVHPVTFLKYKPLRYRVICCSAAWIITLGSCLSCIFIIASLKMLAYIWFFSTQFLLFLSIQWFCLVAVLRALKQTGPGERMRERNKKDHMKRRAFHIILITTVSMTVMHVPFTVTGFLTFQTQQNGHALWNIGLSFYVLASFVQPVLYLHRTGKLSCLCTS
ncbi:2-oxoglutarate receptor 1-like [Labeo rohita]|uniref:2-oxoglutarate receptor 1-like n=1 Tax=Labeo rohita TaxID=84645 RepID=UPI0021E258C5|nr:2-oxoglutarate receptor 1-like [Labeo rohita]